MANFRLPKQFLRWGWTGSASGQDLERPFGCSGPWTSSHRRSYSEWSWSDWSEPAPVNEGHNSIAGVAIRRYLCTSGMTFVPVLTNGKINVEVAWNRDEVLLSSPETLESFRVFTDSQIYLVILLVVNQFCWNTDTDLIACNQTDKTPPIL